MQKKKNQTLYNLSIVTYLTTYSILLKSAEWWVMIINCICSCSEAIGFGIWISFQICFCTMSLEKESSNFLILKYQNWLLCLGLETKHKILMKKNCFRLPEIKFSQKISLKNLTGLVIASAKDCLLFIR